VESAREPRPRSTPRCAASGRQHGAQRSVECAGDCELHSVTGYLCQPGRYVRCLPAALGDPGRYGGADSAVGGWARSTFTLNGRSTLPVVAASVMISACIFADRPSGAGRAQVASADAPPGGPRSPGRTARCGAQGDHLRDVDERPAVRGEGVEERPAVDPGRSLPKDLAESSRRAGGRSAPAGRSRKRQVRGWAAIRRSWWHYGNRPTPTRAG